MPFLTLNTLPEIYKNSNYFTSISEIDGDEFYVPDQYYDENLTITNYEKFKKVIEIVKFWGFFEAPDEIEEYIYKNNKKIDYFNTISRQDIIRNLIIKILSDERIKISFSKDKNNVFKSIFEVVVYWNLFEEKIFRFHDFCFIHRDGHLKDFFKNYLFQNNNELVQKYDEILRNTDGFSLIFSNWDFYFGGGDENNYYFDISFTKHSDRINYKYQSIRLSFSKTNSDGTIIFNSQLIPLLVEKIYSGENYSIQIYEKNTIEFGRNYNWFIRMENYNKILKINANTILQGNGYFDIKITIFNIKLICDTLLRLNNYLLEFDIKKI